jgi:2-polyprenyl-3-methyl-5-hydroxy-6-metoxy-1,4-benzoquinol methylase
MPIHPNNLVPPVFLRKFSDDDQYKVVFHFILLPSFLQSPNNYTKLLTILSCHTTFDFWQHDGVFGIICRVVRRNEAYLLQTVISFIHLTLEGRANLVRLQLFPAKQQIIEREAAIMENPRIELIREEEKKYHERCFENYKLYEEGSWLDQPVPVIMEYASRLNFAEPVQILDLGCGVGRNSLPLAKMAMPGRGRIQCVDLLDVAIEKLQQYSKEFGVASAIETETADIGEYRIRENAYHYIIAASSLEHAKSEAVLKKVLRGMAAGTKNGGLNCIIMNTNIEEYDKTTGEKRKTLIEIVMRKQEVLEKLRSNYDGWEQLHFSVKPMELEIDRHGVPVIMSAETLSFVVRRR